MNTTVASRTVTPPPVLGPAVPQDGGGFFRALGRTALKLAGWRLVGEIPNIPRFVIIVAPHTSNWDFPVGLAVKWALGLNVKWFGKDTLFRPPLGWFMRAVGGLPVDRQTANALVERSAREFAERAQLIVVLAPEGTRQKTDRWRSGFYHIARTANVPILCAAMDWGRREIRFGPTLMATPGADPSEDIARIKAHYNDVTGRHPHQQT